MAITAGEIEVILKLRDELTSQVTKAQASLKGLKLESKELNQALEKFGGSETIKRATDYAAAISQVGGATKLTTSEQRQANQAMTEALEKFKALGVKPPAVMREIAAATSGAKSEIQGLVTSWATSVTAALALTTVVKKLGEFLWSSVEAAAAAEESQSRMVGALQAQGMALPGVIAHYEDLAKKYQSITAFSDEAVKEAEVTLTQIGRVVPDEMDKALKATVSLAAGMKMELGQAADIVAKAADGQVTSLRRLGIVLDEDRAKSEGLDYVLRELDKRFGDAASREMDTYAGMVKKVGNEFDELKEAIGGIVLPHVVQFLKDVNSSLAGFSKLFGDFKVTMMGYATGGMSGAFAAHGAYVDSLNAPKPAAVDNPWVKAQVDQASRDAREAKAKEEREARDRENRKKALEQAKQLEQAYQAWKRAEIGVSDEQLKLFRNQERLITELGKKSKVELSNYLLTLMPVTDRTEALVKSNGALTRSAVAVGDAYHVVTERMAAMYFQMGRTNDTKGLFKGALSVEDLLKGVKIPGQGFGSMFQGLVGQMPGVIMSALTGGGNLGKSLGGLMGGGIGSHFLGKMGDKGLFEGGFGKSVQGMFGKSGFGKMLGGQLAGMMPAVASMGMSKVLSDGGGKGMMSNIGSYAAAGMMFGPWGAAIGAGVGAVVGLFKKGANDTKKAREEFAKSVGSDDLGALYKKLQGMGAAGANLANTALNVIGKHDKAANEKWMKDVEAFLAKVDTQFGKIAATVEQFGGKAPKAFQPLIDQLLKANGLTEAQRKILEGLQGPPPWQVLEEAAGRYGLALDKLGAGFNQLKSNDVFDKLFSDWTMFSDAGADAQAVFEAMSKSVSDAFNKAKKFGISVPEFMRPLLEQMVAAGQLFDENGNKIENLEGIKFTSIESSLDKIREVLESIKDLLTNIGGPASDAARRGLGSLGADPATGGPRMPRAIDDMPGGVGFGDRTVNFNLTTPLATVDSIRQMVYAEIGPAMLDMLENNTNGTQTRAREILGVTGAA